MELKSINELNTLIGLSEVKRQVRELVNTFKVIYW